MLWGGGGSLQQTSIPSRGEMGKEQCSLLLHAMHKNQSLLPESHKTNEDLATVSLNFYFLFTLIWQHSPVNIAQFLDKSTCKH